MKEWTPGEIRDFRKRLGLPQTEFGKILGGVTGRYVSMLEGGERRPGKSTKALLDCLEEKENMRKEVRKHGKRDL